jgi:hypothetical protein
MTLTWFDCSLNLMTFGESLLARLRFCSKSYLILAILGKFFKILPVNIARSYHLLDPAKKNLQEWNFPRTQGLNSDTEGEKQVFFGFSTGAIDEI